jgi:hypothetical protein
MSERQKVPLVSLAQFVRSKNAGPFRLTLDIVFRQKHDYELVRDSGVISPEAIAGLYGIDVDDITDFVTFDPGKAIKITMKRRVSSGAPGDTDVYGAQQHAPLLSIMVERP